MSDRPVSETMARLLEAQRGLYARARKVDEEVERAVLAEAAAIADFKLAHATAFIDAEGSAAMREAVADRDTIEALRVMESAKALRRSAMSAASTLHHELDAMAAISHVANREMKTEMALAGRAEG